MIRFDYKKVPFFCSMVIKCPICFNRSIEQISVNPVRKGRVLTPPSLPAGRQEYRADVPAFAGISTIPSIPVCRPPAYRQAGGPDRGRGRQECWHFLTG